MKELAGRHIVTKTEDLIEGRREARLHTISARPRTEINTANKVKLVLVDDDDDYRVALASNLMDEGFTVANFRSGVECLDHFRRGGECDVVILDWWLEGMSGLRCFEQLRRNGIMVPVIALTGYIDEIHEDVALRAGMLDYIDKSRRLSILINRIRRITEKNNTYSEPKVTDTTIEAGLLTLKPDFCRAFWDEQPVNLTITEFRIVHKLVIHRGRDVAYRHIYDAVHGENFVAGDGDAGHRTNVRALIRRIRRKFLIIDEEFNAIQNYPGFGYRWVTADDAEEPLHRQDPHEKDELSRTAWRNTA